MTDTTLGPAPEAPGPLRALGDVPSKGRKLLRSPWVITPVLVGAALIAADIQQQGAQRPADCTAVERSFPVAVPKTHVPMIGWLTGALDASTQLRDVMARTHPDVALTAIVASNPDMHLTPLGAVPATSGGVACVRLPQAVAPPVKAVVSKVGKSPAP